MEAFHLLSRGGAKFDKRRFGHDVSLFDARQRAKQGESSKSGADDSSLPAELDFFKYTHSAAPKRKAADHDGDDRQQSHEGPAVKKRAKAEDERAAEPSQHPVRHRIAVKGLDAPAAIDSFEELREQYQFPSRLLQNLSQHGYNTPTAIQAQGIPILLKGRDLAAISPTGTGKTLSYLISIMVALKGPNAKSRSEDVGNGVRALILAPTRELVHQIYNECNKLALGRKWRILQFNKATASLLADKNVRDKVDVIVSTPLRLVTSLQNGSIDLDNVRHLVLDEADRLLDSEFFYQTEEIVAACTHPTIQKMVFSATLPAGVEKIAMGALRNPIRVVVGVKDTPLPNISQALTYVADEASKLPTLLQYLSQPYTPPIIIFTSTQPRASSLAEQLVLNNVPNVDCLHAGMTKKEREDAVTRMRKGDSWIMISTEVMARGMDFKGVRGVINFDFPTSVQSYIHRIGRTGRAGREGTAITYFTDADAPFLKPIANVILQSGSSVPEWMTKLPKPSKLKRRLMGKVQRGEAVTKAPQVGRSLARKKREMIEGSKRRKVRTSDQLRRKKPTTGVDGQSPRSMNADNSP